MKTILILGDCQSNGNNCLSDEIMGDTQPRTFSLRYHKQIKPALQWCLKQNDFVGHLDSLESKAWKFVRHKEMSLAWPSMINGYVTNLSFNGAHFFGHCRRLINWLRINNRPDLVLVTDYEFSHLSYSVMYQGRKHHFESLTVTNSDPTLEKLRQETLQKTFLRDRKWHARFHRRSFKLLIKILKNYNIDYAVVRFGQCRENNHVEFENFLNEYIDCTDLRKTYTVDDRNLDFGAELAEPKKNTQKNIAARVNNFLYGP